MVFCHDFLINAILSSVIFFLSISKWKRDTLSKRLLRNNLCLSV